MAFGMAFGFADDSRPRRKYMIAMFVLFVASAIASAHYSLDVLSASMLLVGEVGLWFILYVLKTLQIYEYNLSRIGDIDDSFPSDHPARLEHNVLKRRALDAAIDGIQYGDLQL